ncbi:MAG: DUF1343 domain-containing protein [Verrucomicrobia bacterium]|nr:DUF1343 domain-containing protein [Verrucomicrobiota bacterium]
MDDSVEKAVADKRTPGGVLWVERHGVAYHRAYGQRALVPREEPMTEDTIFDAASLTKVIATTPAVMLLIERGQVKLDEPVRTYVPEFKGDGKEAITVRQLLVHTSGLRPDVSLTNQWTGYDTAIRLACEEKLQSKPGEVFRYSDINFFLLGELVQRVTGQKLNEFVAREVFQPLNMVDTGFLPLSAASHQNVPSTSAPAVLSPSPLRGERAGVRGDVESPLASKLPRIAPTEKQGDTVLRGIVHDPTARRMGGVAGHAGLFTTAADLARFARLMLNGGELDGVRIFKPKTVKLMTSVQTPESLRERRGLGWDIDSPYAGPRGKHFPIGSYGHTGWTGTSLWIDPFSRTFVILLSNRNHPTEDGSVLTLRSRLGTLAAEAVKDFNFAYVPGALPARPSEEALSAASARSPRPPVTREVLNGIDVLVKQDFAPLKGLRVGLITNHTGHDRQRRPTIDLLKNAPGVQLKSLFSPEHGIRGARDEKVGDSIDEQTGLPIFSLYGERRAPTPEHLRDLDALVFDIQDIGCRFYTYISTMGLAMEAAAKAGKKFFVLDRVNPINGVTLDGPVLAGETSFTGFHAIPVRHGLTVGELARLFNAERGFNCDLTVIPLEGWTRDLWFDQTGLPWTNPSPNMRSLTEATLYPGIGLLETTALSVGRGTDTPFEIIGAPYIDDLALAAELNRAALPGVRFIPVRFTPKASTFKDQPCAGVNILLTERERCDIVTVGLLIAQTLHRLHPQHFDLEKFDRLLVHRATVEAIRSGTTLTDVCRSWSTALDDFKRRRDRFLLYK